MKDMIPRKTTPRLAWIMVQKETRKWPSLRTHSMICFIGRRPGGDVQGESTKCSNRKLNIQDQGISRTEESI